MRMMVMPVHRRRPPATPAGSAPRPRQRGSSEAWILKQPSSRRCSAGRRQDQAVGDHHQRIELQPAQQLQRLRRLEADRLMHRRIPSSSARLLTGLACSAWPRPAGRSGCVKTAHSPCRVSASASSAGTANSGVPAKPSLREAAALLKTQRAGAEARARFAPRGSLLALFFQAPADQLALEFGQIIDEQLAFEMIHLVLDAHGQQAIGVHLERLAVATQRPHADMGRARQFVVDAGQRQTALFAGALPSG